MPRQKLKRFEENAARSNVLEANKEIYSKLKGQWNKIYFEKDQPITLELGCGKGEYTVGLGRQFPERNFIGVDVKGDRLWVGSTLAEEENLNNVAFLRAQIQHIEDFFATDEVAVIWITFPDPRPKLRDEKRRLTAPRFLEYYKRILQAGGFVHFKTDNTGLFEYTLETLNNRTDIADLVYTNDLYRSEFLQEHHGIKTKFEEKFHALGENIKYLKFRFTL